jgi:hypothetical protein
METVHNSVYSKSGQLSYFKKTIFTTNIIPYYILNYLVKYSNNYYVLLI